jgi:hypothetical protein
MLAFRSKEERRHPFDAATPQARLDEVDAVK